jgi:hypothetical protein
LGQPEAGEIAFLDTLPKSIAEIVLQNSEFHAGSIAWIIAMRYFKNDFHSWLGITTLTEIMYLTQSVFPAKVSTCFTSMTLRAFLQHWPSPNVPALP